MQWDDAGDGAGLPETGERDAVQGTEPGAERHAAEYKAVALGDAVIGSAAGASGDVPGTDGADDAVAADAAGAADTASSAGEAVPAGVDTPAVDEAATSVIGNVPVPTAAEGKTEPAAQEGAGAAGQQAADDEGMQFLDNPAWDIPDVMFPSMGGIKDASSGSGPSYGAPSPYVPLPEPEDTVRPVHGSASDPLGLEGVSDIPTVPEEEEPQGNNDVTMVIQPLSAFPTPTQSVPPTAGMTPQSVPLPPEVGAAVPPHGSGEPGGKADGKADGSSRKQHGHRRAIIIAVVAVVVVALAATGGFLWWRHVQNQNDLDQAASLCKTSKTKADKAFSELQSALNEAKPAQQIPQGDVSDPTVLETLNSAVTKASSASEPVSCDVALGTETLNANASKNKQIARASTKAKTNVAKAAKAVNDGKAEKIEFIKHELQTAVTAAQKIYDDSKGVVLDDSTRTTLQSAIDQANALLQQDDADLNEMQQSIADVKDAGDAVTVSMNEYTAQQKYLEQQRQQQQQQDDQNDNGDDLNGSTDSQIGDSRGHETQPTHPQGSDD